MCTSVAGLEGEFRSVNPKSIGGGGRRKGVEIGGRVGRVKGGGEWSFWTAKTLIWRGRRSKACQAVKIDGGKETRRAMVLEREREAKKYKKKQVRISQSQTVRICVCVCVCVYAHHVVGIVVVVGYVYLIWSREKNTPLYYVPCMYVYY